MRAVALHDWGAHALGAAYQAKELSPLEVTQAVLDHIDRWEPVLHASYLLRPELALAQARDSEARWQRNRPLGPLDGVPVTIKDNIATQGDPTPLGTAATELIPAARNAPAAERLREAGAVLVCKTTMPDYGMLSSGLSTFHALARNPWDLSKTPGAAVPAQALHLPPVMVRCTWAPTLVARCACPLAGAAFSASSPALAGCRLTRPTPAVRPAP